MEHRVGQAKNKIVSSTEIFQAGVVLKVFVLIYAQA